MEPHNHHNTAHHIASMPNRGSHVHLSASTNPRRCRRHRRLPPQADITKSPQFEVLIHQQQSAKKMQASLSMLSTTQSTADTSSFQDLYQKKHPSITNAHHNTIKSKTHHQISPGELLSSSSESSDYSYDSCQSDSASESNASEELNKAADLPIVPSVSLPMMIHPRSQTAVLMKNEHFMNGATLTTPAAWSVYQSLAQEDLTIDEQRNRGKRHPVE